MHDYEIIDKKKEHDDQKKMKYQGLLMKGYSKCGAFIGFLARNYDLPKIPKECSSCPQAYTCAVE